MKKVVLATAIALVACAARPSALDGPPIDPARLAAFPDARVYYAGTDRKAWVVRLDGGDRHPVADLPGDVAISLAPARTGGWNLVLGTDDPEASVLVPAVSRDVCAAWRALPADRRSYAECGHYGFSVADLRTALERTPGRMVSLGHDDDFTLRTADGKIRRLELHPAGARAQVSRVSHLPDDLVVCAWRSEPRAQRWVLLGDARSGRVTKLAEGASPVVVLTP